LLFRSDKPASARQNEQARKHGSGSLSNLLDALDKEFPLPGLELLLR